MAGALHFTADPPIAHALSLAGIRAISGPALRLVLERRLAQIERHGYTTEHDAQHVGGEIAQGALAMLAHGVALQLGEDATDPLATGIASRLDMVAAEFWPFAEQLTRPTDRIHAYANAAAMLLAELDRLLAGEDGRDG